MEVVDLSLGDMLRCLVKTTLGWEMVLSQAEFAYNNSINRSTGPSPFHICTRCDKPMPLDLAPLRPMFTASASTIKFANHIQGVH